MSSFSSRFSRANCRPSCASKAARLCPSTPPLPRFSFTFSQAISRFFRLYTLSINEWTFLAPVRCPNQRDSKINKLYNYA